MTEEKSENNLSICELMKDDASEVFRKMESQIPLMFQNYSNLYTQHLHMLDDVFGTCFIAEKKFFDKLNLDPKILKQIKTNSEAIKKIYLQNIENSSKYLDEYTKMNIKSMKSFDNFIHEMMSSYANMLSQHTKS
ncbi:hypothetical protein [Nitrosopumilus sp.]|uniref:hypothetical protein n=1 Tax=Nitrosopumilus sp. TaxID=2024843 RepID=UPI003D0CDBD5